MDRVAVLRFLLAVVYWCLGSPLHEDVAASAGSFPADSLSKLDDDKECFNLFGQGRRFYQCTPGEGAKLPEMLSADYLIHEIPTGTNKWLFRHSTDGVDGLCPACCALGLLRLPAFAASGGRGKPPAINAKPPIYAIPVGPTLAATLRLSWRKAAILGTPGWKRPDTALPRAGEIPLLTGLTWLPRRVWLEDPTDPEASCISCGRRGRLVRHSVFAGIGSMKTEDGTPGRVWYDPHVIHETSSKGEVSTLHASDALGASDAAAGQWTRVLSGLIQEPRALVNAEDIWVVGFASVQNDKYLEATESLIRFPYAPKQIHEAVERIERWRKQCWGMSLKARPPDEKKGHGRKYDEIPATINAIRPHVESSVSSMAGELAFGDDASWQEAARKYNPMMEAVAWSLSPGATTATVLRRRQIAGAVPDMRPRTEPEEKSGQKKGGRK